MTQNEIIPTIDDGWRGSRLFSLFPHARCAVMNGACHKEIFRRDAIRWEEHEMIARITQKVTLMRVHMHMQVGSYLEG